MNRAVFRFGVSTGLVGLTLLGCRSTPSGPSVISETDYKAIIRARNNRFQLAVVPDVLNVLNELGGKNFFRQMSFDPEGTVARDWCATRIALTDSATFVSYNERTDASVIGKATAFYESATLEANGYRLDLKVELERFTRGSQGAAFLGFKNQKAAQFLAALQDPKVLRFSTPEYEIYLGKKENRFREISIEGRYPVPVASRVHYVSRPNFERDFLHGLRKAEWVTKQVVLKDEVQLVWGTLDWSATTPDSNCNILDYTGFLLRDIDGAGTIQCLHNTQTRQTQVNIDVDQETFDKFVSRRITTTTDGKPRKFGPVEVRVIDVNKAGKPAKKIQITYDSETDFSKDFNALS